MTDKEFKEFLKSILELLEKSKDLEEAKKKLKEKYLEYEK